MRSRLSKYLVSKCDQAVKGTECDRVHLVMVFSKGDPELFWAFSHSLLSAILLKLNPKIKKEI